MVWVTHLKTSHLVLPISRHPFCMTVILHRAHLSTPVRLYIWTDRNHTPLPEAGRGVRVLKSSLTLSQALMVSPFLNVARPVHLRRGNLSLSTLSRPHQGTNHLPEGNLHCLIHSLVVPLPLNNCTFRALFIIMNYNTSPVLEKNLCSMSSFLICRLQGSQVLLLDFNEPPPTTIASDVLCYLY